MAKYNCSLKTLYGFTRSTLKQRLIKMLDIWAENPNEKTHYWLLEEMAKTADVYLYKDGNPYDKDLQHFFEGYGYKPLETVDIKIAELDFKEDRHKRNVKYYKKRRDT